MITFLTLNTFLLEIRLLGAPLYPTAPHLAARLAALPGAVRALGADVVCLQEVFRRPHRVFLAASLRDLYPHCAGLSHPGPPLGTGLLVLSRHEIEAVRVREFRAGFIEEKLAIRKGLLECVLRLPGVGRCRVLTCQTIAGGLFSHPESARAEACRADQIGELLRHADGDTSELTVIAGDLNAGATSSVANYRQVIAAGFVDAFAAMGGVPEAGITWDPGNPVIAGAGNRALPPQRIDHILLRNGQGAGCRVEDARVVLHESCVTLADGRRVPVSDHYGLLARIAPNA